MRPRAWLFAFLCSASYTTNAGPGTDIRGVVVDSISGERIPLATVYLPGIGKGASTNSRGFYLIPSVPNGTHELVVRALGFESYSRHVVVSGSEPLTVDIQLLEHPIELMETVVEGGRDVDSLQVRASVHTLGRKELRSVPMIVQEDVFRSLQVLPGVLSASDVSSKFYVRGGAGDQNLILLDGMKIYSPFHAFGIFSIFDPDIIKSTEVHTAAFPAGYGGRLSSVIALTTRGGHRSEISGKVDMNSMASKVHLEGPAGSNNTWLVSARKSLFDNTFRYFLKDPLPISFYDVFFKGTLGISSVGRQSVQGFLSGDDITPDDPSEPDYSWRNQALGFSISGLVDDRIYFDATAYSTRFRANRNAKGSTESFDAESNVEDIGLRMELTFYGESRDLIHGGFEFSVPKTENTFTTVSSLEQSFVRTDAEFWIWCRYITSFGRLQMDVGLHTEIGLLVKDGPWTTSLQPRVNLSFPLAESWRIVFGYGVTTQNIITISNEDDVINLFEAWLSLPDDLRPEESHHYVIGLEGVPFLPVVASIQSYYKSFRSIALYNRQKTLPSQPDFVKGKGESYGMESLLRYASSLVDLYLSYTLGWTTVTSGGLSYSPRYDRRHTINALGVYHVLPDMDVALRWEFGSGYPFSQTVGYYERLKLTGLGGGGQMEAAGSPYAILGSRNAVRLPAYHRLDASLTYRFVVASMRGTAGVHASNIYNRKNILLYDRKTGERINMISFAPSASVSLEF